MVSEGILDVVTDLAGTHSLCRNPVSLLTRCLADPYSAFYAATIQTLHSKVYLCPLLRLPQLAVLTCAQLDPNVSLHLPKFVCSERSCCRIGCSIDIDDHRTCGKSKAESTWRRSRPRHNLYLSVHAERMLIPRTPQSHCESENSQFGLFILKADPRVARSFRPHGKFHRRRSPNP